MIMIRGSPIPFRKLANTSVSLLCTIPRYKRGIVDNQNKCLHSYLEHRNIKFDHLELDDTNQGHHFIRECFQNSMMEAGRLN